MALVQINPASQGLQDFVDEYNNLVVFLNAQELGDQYIPGSSGTVALPAFAFTGDTDTGFYSPPANQIAMTLGGVRKWLATGTLFTHDTDVNVSGDIESSGVGTFALGLVVSSGGLDVTGASVFNQGVSILSGGLDVSGNSSITGDFDVTGSLTSNSFVSDTSIDFSTTFAGINKTRVVNSFSLVRQIYLSSFG